MMEEGERDQQILLAITLLCALLQFQPLGADTHKSRNVGTIDQVHVGLVVDVESWEGKIVNSSIEMAISDFYREHYHYVTRLVPHSRDSKGEPLRALSAALDLVDSINVEAIVGAQTQWEAKLLSEIGEKARIPIISFFQASPQPSKMYPFFVQIADDKTSQVKPIIAMIETCKWREVVLIYDISNSQSEVIPHLTDLLQKKNMNINHRSVILTNSTSDERLVEELCKIKDLHTELLIVDLPHYLLSPLFINAEKLGMMSNGYVWVMTTTSTDGLRSIDSSVIEKMEGLVGIKNYIQDPWRFDHFTSRMREKLSMEDLDEKMMYHLSSLGKWAYDGIWCLAMAIERANIEIPLTKKLQITRVNSHKNKDASAVGPTQLLKEMYRTKFDGLSGKLQFSIDGKLMLNEFEIVNVMGNGERRVGFWNPSVGFWGTSTDETKMGRRRLSSKKYLDAVGRPKDSLMKHETIRPLRIGVPFTNTEFGRLAEVKAEDSDNVYIKGLCIKVFETAVGLLDYEIPYELIPFESQRKDEMAGTYDDLVYQVYLGNFDAVVGDVTITENRSKYVDFTIPFTDMGMGMVALGENKNMWIFMKPLSTSLWIASACFFVLTGCVVWIIERPINKEFQGPPSTQIATVLSFSFSSLVYAHREKLVNNLSKFVMIVWLFLVFILNSSYTATLASMMTVKQLQLNPKESYIGYHMGSSTKGVINNLNFKDSRIKPYSSPQEFAEALLKGSKNGGVSAIIDEIPYIKLFLAQFANQNFYLVRTMPVSNGFGFAFPKGSPLAPDISRAIVKLRQEERLKAMEDEWFQAEKSAPMTSDSSSTENNPTVLTFDNFRGLFFISGTSSALAILIFLLFHIHERSHLIREFTVLFWRRVMDLIVKSWEKIIKFVRASF